LYARAQLAEYYFTPNMARSTTQSLVGKHEGRICRLHPTATSLEALCQRHGCEEPEFPQFIRSLLALDPQQRGTAADALKHPFLTKVPPGSCPPYKLAPADKAGEAGVRLLEKYKSLENVEAAQRRTGNEGLADEDVPGPATPTSFREQCYLDRERLEKKRSRKSGLGRWTGGGGGGGGSSGSHGGEDGARAALDSMMISPKTPASTDPAKKGRPSDE
jgi:uncharacterized membrane protein YgcG